MLGLATQCLKFTQKVEFEFWHFSSIFVQLKLTCLVALQGFQKLAKLTIFGI